MNNQIIKKELLDRFQRDQQNIGSNRFSEISKENTLFLKEVIRNWGWPNEERVGNQAELAAWLIAQHSDFDIAFQKECLTLIKNLPQNSDRSVHIQYLTDRILVNEGKKQVYDTQNERRG